MKNLLSNYDAWQKLLCGETVSASRLSASAGRYLRRRAQEIRREFITSGSGAFCTYSLG